MLQHQLLKFDISPLVDPRKGLYFGGLIDAEKLAKIDLSTNVSKLKNLLYMTSLPYRQMLMTLIELKNDGPGRELVIAQPLLAL